ncbi:MAG: tyrosine-type recombinase/integrase [Candidatus Scalinduaceae bacterium]
MMVINGVDLATIKEILGHSDIKMTIRYAHLTAEGKMNAVKTLERQMEVLDSRNTVATEKLTSIPRAITNYMN